MADLLKVPHEESDPGAATSSEDQKARETAIRQIERRRRFHVELVLSTLAMLLLILVWAVSEYHNAGGWPTQGFSQSSGIHDVWNYWIVYPVGAILVVLSGRAWLLYGRRPISESEIDREMQRQGGRR